MSRLNRTYEKLLKPTVILCVNKIYKIINPN